MSNKVLQLSLDQLAIATRRPVCIISHPRSGTHLAIDFIRRHFPQTTRWKLPLQDSRTLILDAGQIWKKETTFEKAFQRLRDIPYPIVKMHGFDYDLLMDEHRDWITWLHEEAYLFYIVRNVRDMFCSYHEYMKVFWEPAHVPMKDFIRQYEVHANDPFTSRVKYWSDEVARWVHKPNAHVFKYEDLLSQPLEQLHRISDILGLAPTISKPLLPPKVQKRWHDYFNRYICIFPATTSVVIHTRTPLWQEVFDQEDLDFIKYEAREALELLNYEI